MKGLLQLVTVVFVCFALVTGDRKGKAVEEESEEVEVSKVPKRNPDRGGQCSCRDLESQVDQLEFRLDRMIDLWNEFVEKNRNSPYDQQGPYTRRPSDGNYGGGRGQYPPPPRYGGGGRSRMEDGQNNGARRFNF